MEACKDYDIVWIQSIPSIAAIYYHRELAESHILHCPDDDTNTPQQPRHIAKSILNTLDSNEKKLAIYFTQPCSLRRRETIFKFLLKSKPELSSFCLSIPTTSLQTNLLLGWAAEISNQLWQRRCAVALDPEAFSLFTPPTPKSGQFECTQYLNEFAISKKKFSKRSLIVDLSNDMISFDIQTGIQFNHCVDHSIKGWIRAAASTPRTLIWIIDEKSLYGEHISSVIQDKRASLLKRYREKLFSSIEAFATTIPIYCYLVNCFTPSLFNLPEYLAQIQHRHHLCLSKTILLERCEDEKLSHSGHLSKVKAVYLNKFPVYTEQKWESVYAKYFSEMKNIGYDKIGYISPEMLDVDNAIENYITPLLNNDEASSDLTISESIGIDDNLHTVSAQYTGIFENWAKLIREAATKDEDANYLGSQQPLVSSSSDSSSTMRKRSFRESQDDEEAEEEETKAATGGDEKKKNKFSESSSSGFESETSSGQSVRRQSKEIASTTVVQSSVKEMHSTAPHGNVPLPSSSSEDNDNNSNSFSSTSLPSIHSSVYCSASSKSFESSISFPTLPSSSGSFGMTSSNSSRKESSYQQSSNDSTIPYNIEEELSQSVENNGQRENNTQGPETERYVSARGLMEEATQYYNPDEENAQTQYYDPNEGRDSEPIVLDDSDNDEERTQPYNADALPTQPYNTDALLTQYYSSTPSREADDNATQPYDANALPTQYDSSHSSHEVGNNDATQPYNSEAAPTQPYGSASGDDELLQENEADETDNILSEERRSLSPSDSRSETDSTREWLSDLL